MERERSHKEELRDFIHDLVREVPTVQPEESVAWTEDEIIYQLGIRSLSAAGEDPVERAGDDIRLAGEIVWEEIKQHMEERLGGELPDLIIHRVGKILMEGEADNRDLVSGEVGMLSRLDRLIRAVEKGELQAEMEEIDLEEVLDGLTLIELEGLAHNPEAPEQIREKAGAIMDAIKHGPAPKRNIQQQRQREQDLRLGEGIAIEVEGRKQPKRRLPMRDFN